MERLPTFYRKRKKKLHKLGEEPRSEDIIQQEAVLRREVNVLLVKEEKMWHQRSRINWLQSGDQNTKFFHTHASRRKRGNWIQGIEDSDGVWHEDIGKIEDEAVQYFTNLFTSTRPQLDERSLRGVHKVITNDMNRELSREFTTEEVSLAPRHMAPLKAPGPDGMPALFYHSFWHIIGSQVTNADRKSTRLNSSHSS